MYEKKRRKYDYEISDICNEWCVDDEKECNKTLQDALNCIILYFFPYSISINKLLSVESSLSQFKATKVFLYHCNWNSIACQCSLKTTLKVLYHLTLLLTCRSLNSLHIFQINFFFSTSQSQSRFKNFLTFEVSFFTLLCAHS
jgi:hypothetical protein